MSSSFAINGIPFPLDPTEHGWQPRDTLGITGYGHPIYPAVREYRMKFVLTNTEEYWQFQSWYNQFSTGSVVADLPKYAGSGYYFYSYTGCIVYEPEQGVYFNQHQTEVNLVFGNVRT